MHSQHPPHTETKLASYIHGKVLDAIVGIRKDSPTSLQHLSVELLEDKMKMLYIPKSFAHSFQSHEDNAEIMYLATECYSPASECGLNLLDSFLKIEWPLEVANMSNKDKLRTMIDDSFVGVEINALGGRGETRYPDTFRNNSHSTTTLCSLWRYADASS